MIALSAFETGQPSLVACTIFWNAALSTPGTVARVLSFIVVIVNPVACFSTVQAALVSTFVAGVPACSSATASAMLKHAASAAASSSSGFEPAPFSNREPNE